MYDNKEIGERIKNIRKNHGMTQSELAEVLHISDKSAISKIEKGVKEININQAVAIAEYFDVSLNYLLRGERFMDNSLFDMLNKIPEEYKDMATKMIMAALSSITIRDN